MRMRRVIATLACLLAFLFFGSSVFSADTAIISGRVTFENSFQIIYDAKVLLYNNHKDIIDSTLTSPGGLFQFELVAGDYYVSAEKGNYIREFYPSAYQISEANRVTAYAGQNVSLYFSLDRGGWLGGTFDYSGGGIDKGLVTAIKIDEPFAGWHKSAAIAETCPYNYVLNGLIPGAYKVVGMATGKKTVFFPDVDKIEDAQIIYISRNSGESNISFMLEHVGMGYVSGRVLDLNSGDGIGGIPIFSYQWYDYWEDPNLHTTFTDDSGYFEFSLPAGDYYFFLNCDECFPGSGRIIYYFDNQYNPMLANAVTVFADFNVTGLDFAVDFSMTHGLAISGNIIDFETGDGFADVVITAFDFNSGQAVNSSYSISSGDFSIDNLPSGNYFLMFSGTSIMPYFYRAAYSWENAEIIILHSDYSNIRSEAITQDYGGLGLAISGSVITPDGPVSGARVYAFPLGAQYPAAYGYSSASGDYTITTGLFTGLYTVICDLYSYNMEIYPYEIDLDLLENPTAENIDFLLHPTQTSVKEQVNLPQDIKVLSNYPNPFNANTIITIYSSSASNISIDLLVFNILGQKVGNKNIILNPGANYITWSGNDFYGNISSGIFFYKVDGRAETHKMIFLK